MRRRRLTMLRVLCSAIAAIGLACSAQAEEAALKGPDISTLLSESSLYADGVEQVFRQSGQTFYMQNGTSSSGSWKVEGDKYCSVWPPNPAWACYDVLRSGDEVIFVSKDGKRYPMRRKP